MTEDQDSLFTPRPRADSISSDDPAPVGAAVPLDTDNPTGWRLAGVWALGSLVVALTGLVVAAVLGTGPAGLADGIERVVVFPISGSRNAADPPPPAAPVPGGPAGPAAPAGPGAPSGAESAGLPGRLPPSGQVTDPGYPVAPGVPLPPVPGTAAPGRPPGTSLPVPVEPTGPASPPTATTDPPVPTEPTPEPTTEPPVEPTTEPPVEPTTEPPVEEPPAEDDPPPTDPETIENEPAPTPTAP